MNNLISNLVMTQEDEIRPSYYELVNIQYKKDGSNEPKVDKAWLAVDDYDRFIWTLYKSNLIIFDDEVIDWWR